MLVLTRFVVAALVLVAVQPGPRFNLETPRQIVRVGEPAIAPDGRSVAVTVRRANLDENRYDAELVLVDIASKSHRVLEDHGPDAHPGHDGRLPRADHPVVSPLPRAARQGRRGAVHRLSGGRPQPDGSGPAAGRRSAMDRVDQDAPALKQGPLAGYRPPASTCA